MKNVKDILTLTECPDMDTFYDYLEGNLGKDKRRHFEMHLADCEMCSDALEGFEQFPRESSRRSIGWIEKEIDQRIQPVEQNRPKWAWYGAAALLLVSLSVGIFLLNQAGEDPKKTLATEYDQDKVEETTNPSTPEREEVMAEKTKSLLKSDDNKDLNSAGKSTNKDGIAVIETDNKELNNDIVLNQQESEASAEMERETVPAIDLMEDDEVLEEAEVQEDFDTDSETDIYVEPKKESEPRRLKDMEEQKQTIVEPQKFKNSLSVNTAEEPLELTNAQRAQNSKTPASATSGGSGIEFNKVSGNDQNADKIALSYDSVTVSGGAGGNLGTISNNATISNSNLINTPSGSADYTFSIAENVPNTTLDATSKGEWTLVNEEVAKKEQQTDMIAYAEAMLYSQEFTYQNEHKQIETLEIATKRNRSQTKNSKKTSSAPQAADINSSSYSIGNFETGLNYYKKGDFPHALSYFKTAKSLEGQDKADIYIALSLIKMGKISEALAPLEEIASHPKDPNYYNALWLQVYALKALKKPYDKPLKVLQSNANMYRKEANKMK